MMVLSLSFFITAVLYAAVGFGGGSTYNALLVLAETDYRILPAIALFCNLIVVSGGAYRFFRAGHIDLRRIAPWIITSVPAAWIGGMLNISETLFVGLLGFSLLAAGARMLWPGKSERKHSINKYRALSPVIGAGLGLLAGLVGIGGGIFLVPVLYLLRWDDAKKIAATCSVFILVNSLAGLAGHMMKFNGTELGSITDYWYLFPAVLIGGQIGSYMGVKRLNPDILRLLTAVLILYVSVRLLWRFLGMVA
jgi:uncharacterized membrane protein YfcA